MSKKNYNRKVRKTKRNSYTMNCCCCHKCYDIVMGNDKNHMYCVYCWHKINNKEYV